MLNSKSLVLSQLNPQDFTLLTKEESKIRKYRKNNNNTLYRGLVSVPFSTEQNIGIFFSIQKDMPPQAQEYFLKCQGYFKETDRVSGKMQTILLFEDFENTLADYLKQKGLDRDQLEALMQFILDVLRIIDINKLPIFPRIHPERIVMINKDSNFKFLDLAMFLSDFPLFDKKDEKWLAPEAYIAFKFDQNQMENVKNQKYKAALFSLGLLILNAGINANITANRTDNLLWQGFLNKVSLNEKNAIPLFIEEIKKGFGFQEIHRFIRTLKQILQYDVASRATLYKALDIWDNGLAQIGPRVLESAQPKHPEARIEEPPSMGSRTNSTAEANYILDEKNYDIIKDDGDYQEYIEKNTEVKYSAYVIRDQVILSEAENNLIKRIKYLIELSAKNTCFLRIYGYFSKISSHDNNNKEDIIVIVQYHQGILSNFMMTRVDCFNMVQEISNALNTPEFIKRSQLTYFTPNDIAVVVEDQRKTFKFVCIRDFNSSQVYKDWNALWTSPELYVNERFVDVAKCLNYSLGLIVLYTAIRKNVLTSHRRSIKSEFEMFNWDNIQKEKAIVKSSINSLALHYGFSSLEGTEREKGDKFIRLLKTSLIFAVEMRSSIEIWKELTERKLQPQRPVNHEFKPNQLPVNESKPRVTIEKSNESQIHILPDTSQRDFAKGEQLKFENSNMNQVYPSSISKDVKESTYNVDWDEMKPFSSIVGIFCGLIFMGIIIVILLVTS